MFIDGRTLPEGTAIDADVVIIGGGAAGITLGLALSGAPFRVAIIESGGFDLDEATQALYEGEVGELTYGPPEAVRLRYFGGTTNHWGGWCRPLDPIDFMPRPWMKHSGWPIKRADLDPYYARAQTLVEAGPFCYDDVEYWLEHSGGAVLPLDRYRVETRFFQYSPPTRFGTRYRAELTIAENVTIYLNLNVTDILTSENGQQVTSLEIKRLDGTKLLANAKHFVLATGGIENARILLSATQTQKNGLGNDNGLVGRFFMDHPLLWNTATLLVFEPQKFESIHLAEFIDKDSSRIRATFMPSDEMRLADRLYGSLTTVDRKIAVWDRSQGRKELAPSGVEESPVGPALMRLMGSLRDAAEYSLGCGVEPEPNPDSRVMLTGERDALGMRRVRVDWKLTKGPVESYARTMATLGRQIAGSGAGLLRWHEKTEHEWPDNTKWASHNIGTTRMSDDAASGVVDAQCRMHGMANLYVAGSSVFPTAGASNPTLTIVALALRLAEHLKGQYAS
jgi:choline dehydrogenase-like flavoprotein